jgi:heptaprenylglyceryl phosphate synthase
MHSYWHHFAKDYYKLIDLPVDGDELTEQFDQVFFMSCLKRQTTTFNVSFRLKSMYFINSSLSNSFILYGCVCVHRNKSS